MVLLPVIFSDSTTSDSSPAYDASAAQRTSGNDEEGMTEELASASTETVNPTNTPQPTNTPTPELEVELISVSDYLSDNTLVLYGEIANSGELPAKEPEIRATLYDINGGILVTESSYADLPLTLSLWFTGVLYPGEKAPFSILIDDPGEWADWEIDLVYDVADHRNFDEHCRDFLILNDTGRAIDDLLFNYRISGEIENTGDKECGPVRFAVTLYDADGNVVGVDTYMSDVDPFVPGDAYPFSIELFARGGVDSYSILTRAIEK